MRIGNLKKDYKIIEEINIGGSDRRFFRCMISKKKYILILDKDIQTYLILQKHLYNGGIGVPRVYRIDRKTNFIIVEDLGKDSLYELVTTKKRDIYQVYQPAITELIKLQIDGYLNVPINVYYDYEHIKWEQKYFRQFFLYQFCKIPMKRLKILDADFECLAGKLIEESKPISNFLMHRDYQSQNIYIKDGRVRIIDFQSARIGPLTYDLAALLKDSYINISKNLENKLLDYYLNCLRKKRIEFERKKFLKIYRLTGLQRNMQALGAFSNLLLNRNKTHFRQYIPRGLKLLKSGLKNSKFKQLVKIVDGIQIE